MTAALAALTLLAGAQATPFRAAPTFQSVLERGGVKVETAKPGTLHLTQGPVLLALVYRAQEYAPFMEPGYRVPDLTRKLAGMTPKQQQTYLENLKPDAPLGTYVQGVMLATPGSDARARQVMQRVMGRMLTDCFAATAPQTAAAEKWLTASWGKEVTRTFGASTLTLFAQEQGNATWTAVSVNFYDFGSRLPNQGGWTNFCREE